VSGIRPSLPLAAPVMFMELLCLMMLAVVSRSTVGSSG
jgi:hypothetical protein